jgi:diadenosine tetraphosphate (Ap4A) HIT family hydrolase
MSTPFTLHLRLAADTIALGDWPLCRLLLMNDARFPWVILVPARADLREIHDLTSPERATLIEEIARVSALMQQVFKADKMNVAALGNQVPQLHIHIIARFAADPAWPNPVWESTVPKVPKAVDSQGVLSGPVADFYDVLQPLLQAVWPVT